jgi:predicted small lipoprotein YifL
MGLVRTAILLAALAGVLAGCSMGRRGAPEPPPGPYVYTTPHDPHKRAQDVRKGDDFILDPLIR